MIKIVNRMDHLRQLWNEREMLKAHDVDLAAIWPIAAIRLPKRWPGSAPLRHVSCIKAERALAHQRN